MACGPRCLRYKLISYRVKYVNTAVGVCTHTCVCVHACVVCCTCVYVCMCAHTYICVHACAMYVVHVCCACECE